MKTRLVVLCLPLAFFLHPAVVAAQWQLNGSAVTVGASPGLPAAVTDGAGGAIIAWEDSRAGGGNAHIYAQHISSAGVIQWAPASGVVVCTAANFQEHPAIISDGAGGAIMFWGDFRGVDFDVYAQRINGSGVVQWAANGVVVSAAAASQRFPTVVADGAGGAVVTWEDFRNGNYDIYAQRINSAGAAQWTANGVLLCTAAGLQFSPTIASDGANGGIVTWQDQRGGNYDIYSQRINASGVVQWTANGVTLCNAAGDQTAPVVISDAAGGAILTWVDNRAGNTDIYTQQVNASGAAQWTANGTPLCIAANGQFSPVIASDGASGAIVSWVDLRSGVSNDTYAQRINAAGSIQWAVDGVALSTGGTDQKGAIVSDGANGAIVSWHRGNIATYDVYAQRINGTGNILWTLNGVPVSTANGFQAVTSIAADAGTDAVIVSWLDSRSGGPALYAQRLEAGSGLYGYPEPFVTSATDVPGDQGGKVAVNWKASGRDVLPLQEIGYYSVWRATSIVSALSGAVSGGNSVDPSTIGKGFHGHAVSHERIGATDYYWEWVANQNAEHDAGYSLAASTLEDSVAGNMAQHYFRVLAHTSNAFVVYKSNVVSGHSVDNVAPPAPLQFTAQRLTAASSAQRGRAAAVATPGDVLLQWRSSHATDLRDYSIYRSTSSNVQPTPEFFLDDTLDTTYVDTTAPLGQSFYYVLAASDVHGNSSAATGIVNVGPSTSVTPTPSLTTLTVLQNRPNPFQGTTELEIGLPTKSDLAIAIYDVAGRAVRRDHLAQATAGWRRVVIDGRDNNGRPLPSGVYFCKVTAGGSTITRKMVIAR